MEALVETRGKGTEVDGEKNSKRRRTDPPIPTNAAPVQLTAVVNDTKSTSDAVAVQMCRRPPAASKEARNEIQSSITMDKREKFFELNEYPITHDIEQKMEQISSIVTKERLATNWKEGHYHCSRCDNVLYHSSSKFEGPCMWPSFRIPKNEESLATRLVPCGAYNHYTCEVFEIYCKECKLFLGHQFDDGKLTDKHKDAKWRHCVLSLSLKFEPL
eukprot:m.267370 g.267370  ORF g.267370 m.267370 type:complete len:216 (+) comp72690_c0_seq1:211-858(+)